MSEGELKLTLLRGCIAVIAVEFDVKLDELKEKLCK